MLPAVTNVVFWNKAIGTVFILTKYKQINCLKNKIFTQENWLLKRI